jgi:hypothetical protein
MYFIFCPTWAMLDQNTPDSEEKTVHVKKANELLSYVP